MDRITHQPPRQQGYGSTSSLRNDSLKHTRKQERRWEESNQETKLPGCGGLSGQAGRTVRKDRADCPARYHGLPAPCRGPSGLSRGLSEKGNRTSRDAPRITERPWGARGLSARHPRTVRPEHADHPKPCPTKTWNHDGSKTKMSKNTKNTRRTRTARTVRQVDADQHPRGTDRVENCSTPKVNTPNPSPDLPNSRSCWDKSLGTWKESTKDAIPQKFRLRAS
jgi:hypothetical protein